MHEIFLPLSTNSADTRYFLFLEKTRCFVIEQLSCSGNSAILSLKIEEELGVEVEVVSMLPLSNGRKNHSSFAAETLVC